MNLSERVAKARSETARLERKRRVERRQERSIQQKREQRRDYVLGELVAKYFPEVRAYEAGTKEENDILFKPVEAFLAALSADRVLVEELKSRAGIITASTYTTGLLLPAKPIERK